MKLKEKILIDLKENKNISLNELCFKYFIFPWSVKKYIRELNKEGVSISKIEGLGTNYSLIRDKKGKYYW